MKFFKILIQMSVLGSSDLKALRLGLIEGYLNKKNEVLYHPPNRENPQGFVVFFGGDVQDYEENMMKHRDNKNYVKWNLESVCRQLHNHFPTDAIVLIKPAKMSLMTFSCYENFVEVNNFGAPTYSQSIEPVKHMQSLLSHVDSSLKCQKQDGAVEMPLACKQDIPIKLIGFSKGCIVLNQLLYSFLALKEKPEEDLLLFANRITDLYWLEGGHSGTSETWITNRAVLENFANMKKTVHIHVTPYQVLCDTRPRIGKEEKIFRETLIRLGCDVKRMLHFENEPRSVENHFRVLEVFKEP